MNNTTTIVKKIEAMTCKVHNKKPISVKVIGGEINAHTCCDDFRNKIRAEIDKNIENAFLKL